MSSSSKDDLFLGSKGPYHHKYMRVRHYKYSENQKKGLAGRSETTRVNLIMKDIATYSNFFIKNTISKTLKHFKLEVSLFSKKKKKKMVIKLTNLQ